MSLISTLYLQKINANGIHQPITNSYNNSANSSPKPTTTKLTISEQGSYLCNKENISNLANQTSDNLLIKLANESGWLSCNNREQALEVLSGNKPLTYNHLKNTSINKNL